jgi:hypothetical protein
LKEINLNNLDLKIGAYEIADILYTDEAFLISTKAGDILDLNVR